MSKKTKVKSIPRKGEKEWLDVNLRYEQKIDVKDSQGGPEVISVPFFSVFFDVDDYYYEFSLKGEPKTYVQDELTRMFEKEGVANPAYMADLTLNNVLQSMLNLKNTGYMCWKGYRTPVWWRKTRFDLSPKKTNGKEKGSEEGCKRIKRGVEGGNADAIDAKDDGTNARDVRGDKEVEVREEGGIIKKIGDFFK